MQDRYFLSKEGSMEHANPLLKGSDTTNKFITIGEIMLRLTPPNYEKIRMASSFELYEQIREGLDDIAKGNTRPFSEAMSDIRSRRKG